MDGDRTDLVAELYDLPFHRHHDVEVVGADADGAAVRWPFDDALVGNPEVGAVHGGVVSALADLAGAAPHVAATGRYTPTVDLRVDYLEHAGAADLTAEATVRRRGDRVGVSDVTVRSGGDRCAVGKGTYMVGDP